MIGRVFVLSLLIVLLYGLTDEEIKYFKPRDVNHVERNTGKKSQIWITDNKDGTLTVYSNGVPGHDTWVFPRKTGNPHQLMERWTNLTVNKEPRMRKEGAELMCLPHGIVGIATSGVAIDGWFASEKGCPAAEEFEELDICDGHPSPSNHYHYHHYSPCVQMPVCGEPSPIYGVALDGIPIYGPYDENGRQLTHQDMDKCGGRYDNKGRYKYHVTVDPPYFIGCFKGEIRANLNKADSGRRWFCSCPWDDTMIWDKIGEPPKRGTEGSRNLTRNCDFNVADQHGSVICSSDAYNQSYEIGIRRVKKRKTVKLAPCCPKGKDCGKSCKTEFGLKKDCVQEEREIDFTVRVYLNGTEVPSTWKKDTSGSEKGEGLSKILFVLHTMIYIHFQKL